MATSGWREVFAQEATEWAKGKVVADVSGDTYNDSTTTTFSDGSAMRVTWERGHVYSEWTSDPDRVMIEVSE